MEIILILAPLIAYGVYRTLPLIQRMIHRSQLTQVRCGTPEELRNALSTPARANLSSPQYHQTLDMYPMNASNIARIFVIFHEKRWLNDLTNSPNTTNLIGKWVNLFAPHLFDKKNRKELTDHFQRYSNNRNFYKRHKPILIGLAGILNIFLHNPELENLFDLLTHNHVNLIALFKTLDKLNRANLLTADNLFSDRVSTSDIHLNIQKEITMLQHVNLLNADNRLKVMLCDSCILRDAMNYLLGIRMLTEINYNALCKRPKYSFVVAEMIASLTCSEILPDNKIFNLIIDNAEYLNKIKNILDALSQVHLFDLTNVTNTMDLGSKSENIADLLCILANRGLLNQTIFNRLLVLSNCIDNQLSRSINCIQDMYFTPETLNILLFETIKTNSTAPINRQNAVEVIYSARILNPHHKRQSSTRTNPTGASLKSTLHQGEIGFFAGRPMGANITTTAPVIHDALSRDASVWICQN